MKTTSSLLLPEDVLFKYLDVLKREEYKNYTLLFSEIEDVFNSCCLVITMVSGRQTPKAFSSRFSPITDFLKSAKDILPSWS